MDDLKRAAVVAVRHQLVEAANSLARDHRLAASELVTVIAGVLVLAVATNARDGRGDTVLDTMTAYMREILPAVTAEVRNEELRRAPPAGAA